MGGNFLTNVGANVEGVEEARKNDLMNQIRQGIVTRDTAMNSTLPEETAARRARFGVLAERDQTDMPNVRKEAKLASTVLDTGQTAAEDQQAQQPMFLGMQHDVLKTNANATRAALEKSNTQLENLPNEILDQRQANLIDDQTAGLKAAGGLSIAMASGDPQQALDFANNVAAARTKFDGKQRAKITTIVPDVPGPDGKPTGVTRMLDADGNTVAEVPHESMHAGRNLLAPPKTMIIPRGGKIGTVSPVTGGFTETGDNPLPNRYNIKGGYFYDSLGKNPPQKLDLPGGANRTALIQNMEFLVNSGVAKDHKEAFDRLHAAVGKPEEDAILSLASTLMSKGTGYRGKDGAAKALDDARRMVQSVRRGSTTAAPTAAPPPASVPAARGILGAAATPAPQGAPAAPAPQNIPQGAVQSAPGLSPKAQQILRDLGVTN